MKRSEMINIMLMRYNYIQQNRDEAPTDKDVMDHILTGMEFYSMLPPSIKNPNWQGGWNMHTHPFYVNEWEKENNNEDDKEWRNRYGKHEE